MANRRKLQKLIDFFVNRYNGMVLTISVFRKEKVFTYFFFIMILMLISASFFLIIEHDRVISSLPNKDSMTFLDKSITVIYWAMTTISTCGYGDIVPASNIGRVMAVFTLFLSVAMVSLFTANLASALTTKRMMERRGIMNLSNYSSHYVICGWKKNMSRILKDIIEFNPNLNLKKIVIVANIEADLIELFKQQNPEFENLSILRGEHFNEGLLKKANIHKAEKAIILADESSETSETEKDSKTIMASMTIRSLSNNIRICAELMDKKFEKYLESAHVEDIIYTNEYSKVLIANTIEKPGMAKIINDLLDVDFSKDTPAFITTDTIPHDLIGKNFLEAQNYFKKNKNHILIGLLENVGNYKERKEEAIREAQKTADISVLVGNLKKAKTIENNFPNINPEDSYIIQKESMAILIGTKRI